jgi:hypothetical protein
MDEDVRLVGVESIEASKLDLAGIIQKPAVSILPAPDGLGVTNW